MVGYLTVPSSTRSAANRPPGSDGPGKLIHLLGISVEGVLQALELKAIARRVK